MPLLWECVVGYVIGPLIDAWRQHGRGAATPATAVGADPEGHLRTVSLPAAERAGVLDHLTWADDFVLVSEERRNCRAWEIS